VSAGRNPPSVLTIFRFAAYLNLVQEHMVRFGLASCGTDFHSVSGNLRQYHHCTLQMGFFSVLLPAISDYPSTDHTSCMKGGVSSAVAACRPPAHTWLV